MSDFIKSSTFKSLTFGHIIECFDNTLYGFFAVLLAPIFFPNASHTTNILASYGAFAAGFLARPLGAIFFGLMGDRYGRRKPLLLSMMLVGIPTLIIGCLPSYSQIGIVAPIMLITCRLFQGFFMGGEFSGANIYITESFQNSCRGSYTGRLIASGIYGAVIATLIGALVTLKAMPDWCWRLPFISGGLMAFTLFYFRKNLPETDVFKKVVHHHQTLSTPLIILVKNYKLRICVASLIAGLTIVPLYCSTILGNKIFNKLGYSASASMLLNTIGMIIDAVLVLYCGKIADKVCFYRQMVVGICSTIIISIPAFYLIHGTHVTTFNVLLFIALLVGVGCIINGCGMPYIADYFPPHCRYSGMALSVTLGHAIFGGTTPLIGSYLIDVCNTNAAPMLWVISLSLLTLIGIIYVRKKSQLVV